ncbi:MAG: sigma-70 family RNA polymerase sigma factor [Pseudomonadota bacterium]
MSVNQSLGAIVRESRGRVLAALAVELNDLALAEDALQDALERALEKWPEAGLPGNPAGWLFKTARRRAIDLLRRAGNFQSKSDAVRYEVHADGIVEDEVDALDDEPLEDERLRLIFTCCHPALAEPARVALTLKTLGRLSTVEIARAFLVPEATMAQRLVRAKHKIKAAGIPYQIPPPELWPERLDSVLSVLYLIFNEGYAATAGNDIVRAELCEEAIRLGRIVSRLAPDATEAGGLLALMLLHDSRRIARTDADGNILTLAAQDRKRWDRPAIDEGMHQLSVLTIVPHEAGPYELQARISAEHATATDYDATNWESIARYYDQLYGLQPSAVVRVNGAIALSYAHGAATGLRALAPLGSDPAMARYQPYHLARADMLKRAGDRAEAMSAYERALALTTNAAERRFLLERIEVLTGNGEAITPTAGTANDR